MTNSDFGIERVLKDDPLSWKLHGIKWGNTVGDIELLNGLLDSGTQEELARRSRVQLESGGNVYLSVPQFYGIADALVKNLNDSKYGSSAKETLAFLKQACRSWPNTSTRAEYEHSGEGSFTHEFGLPTQHVVKVVSMVGPDELISGSQAIQFYQALFGTNDDTKRIHEVLRSVNGTNAYGYRVNSNPRTKDTRVVRLNAYSVRFNVSCNRYPQYEYSALGGKVSPRQKN
jgi:hypothetical protein